MMEIRGTKGNDGLLVFEERAGILALAPGITEATF